MGRRKLTEDEGDEGDKYENIIISFYPFHPLHPRLIFSFFIEG